MLRSFFLRHGFRLVRPRERFKLLAHLERLPAEDLRHRFGAPADAESLRAHVELAGPGHETIGWFNRGLMRGAIEIFYAGDRAEAGLTVEPEWRGYGVGTTLVRRALRRARLRGARSLAIHSNRGNAPMLNIAAELGAEMAIEHGHGIEPGEPEPGLVAWFAFDLTGQPPLGPWERLLARLGV